MVPYIIGAILVFLVLFVISSYNGFVRLSQKVKEAFSQMDVYLKKRYDLIPNIVETVKGYATHEKETLQSVIQARNSGMSASSIEDVKKSNDIISKGLSKIFALREAYPELKADKGFTDLQKQLGSIENEIANSRKYYNAVVKPYNSRCLMVPHVFIAKLFGFTAKPYFQADEGERQNVQVKF